jgi:2-methylcitrate dehydratase
MDESTSRIADYASTLAYEDLPAEVVHECKRRLVDTVGCALGAFDDEPSRIARALGHDKVPHEPVMFLASRTGASHSTAGRRPGHLAPITA